MSDSNDLLSETLMALRLHGGLYFHDLLQPPWQLDIPDSEHHVKLHLAASGQCRVLVEDACVPLSGGELVVIPHGVAHRIEPIDDTPTRLICGQFSYDGSLPHPLLASLPPLIHLGCGDCAQNDWLSHSMRFIEEEAINARPGFNAMVDRLTEVLLIQALRQVVERETAESGFLAGLRDPALARALAAVHQNPAHAWTLAEMAEQALLSRSAFAARFVQLMGLTPLQYLTRWRMTGACRLLRDSSLGIVEVAERSGYQSEAAFSRVFKRLIGVGPGRYRREANAGKATLKEE